MTGNFTVDLALAAFLALLMLLPLKTGVSTGSWLLVKAVWLLQWAARWMQALFQAFDAGANTWLECRREMAETTDSHATLDLIAIETENKRARRDSERPTRALRPVSGERG